MNVFAIHAVSGNTADLLAEAEIRRLLREAQPQAPRLVASIREAARSLTAARTPKAPIHQRS